MCVKLTTDALLSQYTQPTYILSPPTELASRCTTMSDDIASTSHISRAPEPSTVHQRDGDNNTAGDAESSFSADQDSVQEDDEFEQAFQGRADAMMEYLKQPCEIPARLDLSYTPRGAVRAEYLNSFFSRGRLSFSFSWADHEDPSLLTNLKN